MFHVANYRIVMEQVISVDGVDVHIEGDGPDTVLMLHGWPDTYRLWDRQVAALRGRYRCVRFTLPGFDLAQPPRPTGLRDMVELIRRIARESGGGRRVILLLHDWGCLFGYQFYMAFPQLVSAIVAVDIGDMKSPDYVRSLSLAEKLMIVSYQWWLAAAWRIGGRAGDAMARMMARAGKAPAPERAGAQMGYPYYIAWAKAYGSYDEARPLTVGCPFLFIYGSHKPVRFHAPQWERSLAHKPRCRVIAMPTGHWPMVERPGPFNAAVLEWLSDIGDAAP